MTAAYLALLNTRHAAARRRLGKAADVVDASLETAEAAARLQETAVGMEKAEGGTLNRRAFDDLTDTQNEDFLYVL